MPAITVLLCTRNPRMDYLHLVLDGLKAQTLPYDQWELLVLDNESDIPLDAACTPLWHPRGQLLRVTPAAKTVAVLHGLRITQSPLLITVDDDNVLAPDYLEQSLRIFDDHPEVGVASGYISGKFETPPHPALQRYLQFLAIRDFLGETPRISKTRGIRPWTPVGAGMVFRRPVGELFAHSVQNDAVRLGTAPGRTRIWRGEDTDLALFSFDADYACGYFPQLRLTHLIPRERVAPAHMENLLYTSAYKCAMLMIARDAFKKSSPIKTVLKRLIRGVYWPTIGGKLRRQMEQALDRGAADACHDFSAPR